MSAKVHVTPVNDLIEHDTESDECMCGPDCELVDRGDGSAGWLFTHHSLDGREKHEAQKVRRTAKVARQLVSWARMVQAWLAGE